jgi:hypothetical protein
MSAGGQGSNRFTLREEGNVVGRVRDLDIVGAGATAEIVGGRGRVTIPGATGSGNTYINQATYSGAGYPVYNVKSAPFNAVGDGVANDTAAIQAAVDACHAGGGGTVFIPPGIFLVTSILVPGTYPGNNGFGATHIIGASWLGTTLRKYDTSQSAMLRIPSWTRVEEITFMGMAGTAYPNLYGCGIAPRAREPENSYFNTVRRCRFYYLRCGITEYGTERMDGQGGGWLINVVEMCEVAACLFGFYFKGSQNCGINRNTFRLCRIVGNYHYGLYVGRGSGTLVTECDFEVNGVNGGNGIALYFEHRRDTYGKHPHIIRDTWFEKAGAPTNAVYILGDTTPMVVFDGCGWDGGSALYTSSAPIIFKDCTTPPPPSGSANPLRFIRCTGVSGAAPTFQDCFADLPTRDPYWQ